MYQKEKTLEPTKKHYTFFVRVGVNRAPWIFTAEEYPAFLDQYDESHKEIIPRHVYLGIPELKQMIKHILSLKAQGRADEEIEIKLVRKVTTIADEIWDIAPEE